MAIGAKLYLEMDGDVSGGDTKLYVQYTVNYKKETQPFPSWSPFLKNAADAKTSGTEGIVRLVQTTKQVQYTDKATGKTRTVIVPEVHKTYDDLTRSTPFATFHETGNNRNGVRVWHEYEYVWDAWKVMEPVPAKVPISPLGE